MEKENLNDGGQPQRGGLMWAELWDFSENRMFSSWDALLKRSLLWQQVVRTNPLFIPSAWRGHQPRSLRPVPKLARDRRFSQALPSPPGKRV